MCLSHISPIETIETVCSNDTTLEIRKIRLSIVNEHMVIVQVLSYRIQKTNYFLVVVIVAQFTMKVVIIAIYILVISLLNKIIKGLWELFFVQFGLFE